MNWGMIGHEWAVNMLSKHIAQGQTRHAYLFSGPQGVGRRTLALRLAQALNCQYPPIPGEFCGECRACVQIVQCKHPDLSIVQAQEQGGTLRVEQVRELQRSLALTPYEASYRVALLLRFEEGNLNAMNALLKTLEEPAPGVVIVLTVDSVENLIPTIVSRCEVMRLRPVSMEKMCHGLQEQSGLPLEVARQITHISGGRPGFALKLIRDPDRLEERHTWLETHTRLLSASRVERFAFAENLAKDRDAIRGTLLVWLTLWRDVLLKSMEATAPVINLDCIDLVNNMVNQYDPSIACNMVASLRNTLSLLEHNINPRLAIENLMLALPRENV